MGLGKTRGALARPKRGQRITSVDVEENQPSSNGKTWIYLSLLEGFKSVSCYIIKGTISRKVSIFAVNTTGSFFPHLLLIKSRKINQTDGDGKDFGTFLRPKSKYHDCWGTIDPNIRSPQVTKNALIPNPSYLLTQQVSTDRFSPRNIDSCECSYAASRIMNLNNINKHAGLTNGETQHSQEPHATQ